MWLDISSSFTLSKCCETSQSVCILEVPAFRVLSFHQDSSSTSETRRSSRCRFFSAIRRVLFGQLSRYIRSTVDLSQRERQRRVPLAEVDADVSLLLRDGGSPERKVVNILQIAMMLRSPYTTIQHGSFS